jgi:hypothetical protein
MKINYPAVVVAAIVHFLIGGVWYALFGNKFIELIGWSPEKVAQMGNENPAKAYILAFLMSLVLVFVLAHFLQYTNARTVAQGLQTAFWLWLGFVVTTQLPTVVFEERPFGLYLLSIGYQFVALLLTGAILTLWKPRARSATAAQLA